MAGLAFVTPWLLWALVLLPILYFLLRATPPAPILRRFPAVALLLGLKDDENTPDRTPWWLLLLRLLALALIIFGFAGPILNPQTAETARGNVVFALDATWASAQSWPARMEKLNDLIDQAEAADRPVALLQLSDPPKGTVLFQAAGLARDQIAGLEPRTWAPDYSAWVEPLSNLDIGTFYWFSDGLDHPDRSDLADSLNTDLRIVEAQSDIVAVSPLRFEEGKISTDLLSLNSAGREYRLELLGSDPTGAQRILGATDTVSEADRTAVEFELPTELRNRVTQIRITGVRSAGAVALTDDSLRTRKIALLSSTDASEGGLLLSSLHYVREALAPSADLIETDLETSLLASPDIFIFADIGRLPENETQDILDWVEEGGTLVRFAGPRLIASEIGQREAHPLLPVRLRSGGRELGGAMSWGEPKRLRPFDEDSPFHGLDVPDEVAVVSQVLAQPDPNLSERVLARLEDGTPLVTAKDQGAGRVVLFHMTANATWSSLPLSGLFLKMLERLSVSAGKRSVADEALAGLIWKPTKLLNGFGDIEDATGQAGVTGELLAEGAINTALPAGIYENQDRSVALNVIGEETALSLANWPASVTRLGFETSPVTELKPILLTLSILLLLVDILASLALTGRLRAEFAAVLLAFAIATPVDAQSDADIIEAVNNTVLAYVITGDARMDETSEAGLRGLSAELYRRTSIEPIAPTGINLVTDDLSLYPFLYWPMTENQETPSDAVISKLNQFLRTGGMIMFDTRDASLGIGTQGGTKLGRKLQEIALKLDIPPLEPIPDDHVLTRSFYLLSEYPGRYFGAPVWVEASPKEERAEGMPFRNLNDNVSPVLIGGNDWAAAWAIDERGRFMFPVGSGQEGGRQREFAQRFGVNLIMHVLTGNYKSDQVHVPALLERLGE